MLYSALCFISLYLPPEQRVTLCVVPDRYLKGTDSRSSFTFGKPERLKLILVHHRCRDLQGAPQRRLHRVLLWRPSERIRGAPCDSRLLGAGWSGSSLPTGGECSRNGLKVDLRNGLLRLVPGVPCVDVAECDTRDSPRHVG